MFPPFPQEEAAKFLEKLILSLKIGETELVQIARHSEERKNQGLMIGSLVCWNSLEKRRVILYAASGRSTFGK